MNLEERRQLLQDETDDRILTWPEVIHYFGDEETAADAKKAGVVTLADEEFDLWHLRWGYAHCGNCGKVIQEDIEEICPHCGAEYLGCCAVVGDCDCEYICEKLGLEIPDDGCVCAAVEEAAISGQIAQTITHRGQISWYSRLPSR